MMGQPPSTTWLDRMRPGDRVTLRLRAWADVSERDEKINRSEIDDPALRLEEPCWGELLAPGKVAGVPE